MHMLREPCDESRQHSHGSSDQHTGQNHHEKLGDPQEGLESSVWTRESKEQQRKQLKDTYVKPMRLSNAQIDLQLRYTYG